jgi:acetyl-CoA carboxylase carboxyltransferase component
MTGYGQVSTAYANQPRAAVRPARRIRKEKKMKLTFKQRIRNWLNDDNAIKEDMLSSGQTLEASRLDSDGMRLQIYKASGGYVVETRNYDRRTDRHNSTMHVIREDQDLGDALGKIVMMEALRG